MTNDNEKRQRRRAERAEKKKIKVFKKQKGANIEESNFLPNPLIDNLINYIVSYRRPYGKTTNNSTSTNNPTTTSLSADYYQEDVKVTTADYIESPVISSDLAKDRKEINEQFSKEEPKGGQTPVAEPKKYTLEEALPEFRKANQPIGEKTLEKWTQKALDEGWTPDQPIPDIHEISFEAEGDILYVTAYSYNEAYAAIKAYGYTGIWYRVGPISEKPVGLPQMENSVNIFNNNHFTYSEQLVEMVAASSSDDKLKEATLKSGKLGDEFIALVKDAQKKIYNTTDTKIITGMLDKNTWEKVQQVFSEKISVKFQEEIAEVKESEKRKYMSLEQEITMNLLEKNADIYTWYYSAGGMENFEEDPLAKCEQIINLLNQLRDKIDIFERKFGNGKGIDRFLSFYQRGTERNISSAKQREPIDYINETGHVPVPFEDDPIRLMLADKGNSALFGFMYIIEKSPYGAEIGYKIKTREDLHKVKAAYEYDLFKGEHSFRNFITDLLKKKVDTTISDSEKYLLREMEPFKIQPAQNRYGTEAFIGDEKGIQEWMSDMQKLKPLFQELDRKAPNITERASHFHTAEEHNRLKSEYQKEYETALKQFNLLRSKYIILQYPEFDNDNPNKFSYVRGMVLNSNNSLQAARNINQFYNTKLKPIITIKEKLGIGTENENDPEYRAKYWLLDQAVADVYHQLNIESGSGRFYMGRHFAEADKKELNNLWFELLNILVGTATMFAPVIAPVTVPYLVIAGSIEFKKEYDLYQLQKSAFDLGLGSEEPTILYMALTLTGIVLDAADLGAFFKMLRNTGKFKKFITPKGTFDSSKLPELKGPLEDYSKKLPQNQQAEFIQKMTSEANWVHAVKEVIEGGENVNKILKEAEKVQMKPTNQTLELNTFTKTEKQEAEKIAALQAEIKKANDKIENIRKTQKLREDEIIMMMGFGGGDIYKIAYESIQLLNLQGKVTYQRFLLFMKKQLGSLDFNNPVVQKYIKEVYDDILMTGISEDRQTIIREFRKANPESLLTNKKLNQMLDEGYDVLIPEKKVFENPQVKEESVVKQEPNEAFIGKKETKEDLIEEDIVYEENITTKTPKLREQYLGKTPGKKSKTGKDVIERMRKEGKIREDFDGNTEFLSSEDGKWYPLYEADMSHIIDAVTWWNEIGRFFGPKSSEVRQWMLDPNNYYLEHFSYNRSQGAKLNINYLPPGNK